MKNLWIIVLMLILSGCASSQQTATVIWHDGECMFFVEGLSTEQAGSIEKGWRFGDCEIKVESELGESEEGAGGSAEVETP